MTPAQFTACAILMILCVTGYKVYDRFIQSKEQKNEKDVINEALSIQSNAMNALAEKLINRTEELAEEHLKTYENPNEITIKTASNMTVLSENDIQEINRRSRRKLKNQDDIKELEIDAIKKSSWDKLTVTCHLVGQDYTFPLYVDLSFIEQEERILLFEAFRDNKTVFVLADYKSYQNKIEKANASSIMAELPNQE
ncbi:Uncharacterised protein [[Pasteurella] mairii]|uniref:Uncharacterized protein n=1 Tax=[Pasteurella] mairii TaxID=757 RepID=A0A379B504_9PAST|nr:Uncharacterised protein [[Pasteurella] mairii]